MISVIIPTYNEEENIERCLLHLTHQTIPRGEYEIIVVDGGSRDATTEIAKRYADRVMEQKSKGVGGARNDGIMVAKGDIIATTDADAVVPNFWLERIKGYIESGGAVGVCGPNYPVEKKIKAILLYGFIKAFHTAFYKMGITGMPGNNTAFRKDVFFDVGMYNTELPYLDDIEFGLRLKTRGKVVYDPSLIVWVSARRMEEKGYLRVLFLWFKGDLRLLGGKSPGKAKYFRKST